MAQLGAQQGCCYYATLPSARPHIAAAASIEIDSVGLRKVGENVNFNLII